MLLICCECENKFYKSSNFIQHFKLKHIGTERRRCPFKNCTSTFRLKYNFCKHFKRYHLESVISENKCDKNLILKEFTTKWLSSKSSKKKTIISKTCDTCGKTFSRTSNLTEHKKSFHSNFIAKKKPCPFEGCKSIGFKTKYNFVAHYKAYHLIKCHNQCNPTNLCGICCTKLNEAIQKFTNAASLVPISTQLKQCLPDGAEEQTKTNQQPVESGEADLPETIIETIKLQKYHRTQATKDTIQPQLAPTSAVITGQQTITTQAIECGEFDLLKIGSAVVGKIRSKRQSASVDNITKRKKRNSPDRARETSRIARKLKSAPSTKLSYASDKEFPHMAHILALEDNEEFGRHIITTEDLVIGDIVMASLPFACVGYLECIGEGDRNN